MLYDFIPAAVVVTVIPKINGISICEIDMKNLIPMVATPGAFENISLTPGYMPVSRNELAIPPTIAQM